jgi:hypothetical protein
MTTNQAAHLDSDAAPVHLYLLRVWFDRAGFAAALRPVGGGEPTLFRDPQEVGRHLTRLACATAEDSTTARELPTPCPVPGPLVPRS